MKLDILITDTENKLGLTSSKINNRLEITGQNTDSAYYTVAYWKKHSEGFDLCFVGRRPFTTDLAALMTLARIGQDLLETELSMDG
jgi:hypothetical protein